MSILALLAIIAIPLGLFLGSASDACMDNEADEFDLFYDSQECLDHNAVAAPVTQCHPVDREEFLLSYDSQEVGNEALYHVASPIAAQSASVAAPAENLPGRSLDVPREGVKKNRRLFLQTVRLFSRDELGDVQCLTLLFFAGC